MASGLDANRLLDVIGVAVGQSAPSGGTAVLANGFIAGASNLGHIRLITTATPSTAQTNGSELSGGSYVAGTGINYTTGASGQFSAPAYGTGSGSSQTNATLSQAGMPAATTGGIEIWDSKGTPPSYASSLRWLWGTLASTITTNSGDTFSFGSGAVVASIVS